MKYYLVTGTKTIYKASLSVTAKNVESVYKFVNNAWTCTKSDKNIEWEATTFYKKGLLKAYPTLEAAQKAAI